MPEGGQAQRIEARVTGRVQGVGFRYSAARLARRLGLVGYVRNLADGSVETVAEGEPADVERYLRWLADGPPAARVDDVSVRCCSVTGTLTDFDIA